MHQVFLLIGGNLSNREELLAQASILVNREIGNIRKSSSIYETEAWELQTEDHFLNQVLQVETQLAAVEVLERILDIEKKLGRKKRTKSGYESRTMDIDILFFDNQEIATKNLIIPHPLLHVRRFVLEPLNEIAPTLIHPKLQLTINELLEKCEDQHEVALAQIG